MNDSRNTRSDLVPIVVTGVVTAFVALAVAFLTIGSTAPMYQATAQLAIIPPHTLLPSDVPSSWDTLGGDQQGATAASVLQAPKWRDAAAQANGLAAGTLTVTAVPISNTSLINMTAQAPNAQRAESALDKIITDATPTAQAVTGPYDLIVVHTAVGTAQQTGVTAFQIFGGVFVGGLIVGAGIAAVVGARRRSREEEAAAAAYGGRQPSYR